jgi:DMSO/TMAO reductase YedYZ heme-binding membrane subunit
MGWHLSFVAYFLITFRPQLYARAIEADVVGFVFLAAMTVTSFRPVARYLSLTNWKRLHKTGIYAIWLLLLYISQGGARSDHDLYHFALLGALIGAWLLRVFAGARKSSARADPLSAGPGY